MEHNGLPTLRVASMFSGIEGFGLGLEQTGHFEVVVQCENNNQARHVLRRHYPNVKLYGDIRTVKANALIKRRIDVMTGGFPCQDISIANSNRKGLHGNRSGLFWHFILLAEEVRPRWIIIENVAGLLSSNRGRDLGTILGTMVECGYGWAYRVLDTQNFGVPQRRRRIYIVGYLGNARRAAKVLFESPSRKRHSAQSEAEEEEAAADAMEGAEPDSQAGAYGIADRSLPYYYQDRAATLRSSGQDFVAYSISMSSAPDTHKNRVATLRGGARGTDVVAYAPEVARPLLTKIRHNGMDQDYTAYCAEKAACLLTSQSRNNVPPDQDYVATWDPRCITSAENRANVYPEKAARTLPTTPLSIVSPWGVHRLMPVECERLQGFPDGWTEGVSDAARYRLIGNAVPVPVIRWIGNRIYRVERMAHAQIP